MIESQTKQSGESIFGNLISNKKGNILFIDAGVRGGSSATDLYGNKFIGNDFMESGLTQNIFVPKSTISPTVNKISIQTPPKIQKSFKLLDAGINQPSIQSSTKLTPTLQNSYGSVVSEMFNPNFKPVISGFAYPSKIQSFTNPNLNTDFVGNVKPMINFTPNTIQKVNVNDVGYIFNEKSKPKSIFTSKDSPDYRSISTTTPDYGTMSRTIFAPDVVSTPKTETTPQTYITTKTELIIRPGTTSIFSFIGGGSSNLGGGGSFSGFKRFSLSKQKKGLTPTLRSAAFGLKGTTSKFSILSGLGERYVSKNKRRKKK
jgi:hypothetical protein